MQEAEVFARGVATVVEHLHQMSERLICQSKIVLCQVYRDQTLAGLHALQHAIHCINGEGIVSQIKVGDQTERLLKHHLEVLSPLSSNLDFILVAVVICQIERDETWMVGETLEKADGSFRLDMVSSDIQVHDGGIVTSQDLT